MAKIPVVSSCMYFARKLWESQNFDGYRSQNAYLDSSIGQSMVVFQSHKLSLTIIKSNKAKQKVHLDESTFI